jgi:hypothetical protein
MSLPQLVGRCVLHHPSSHLRYLCTQMHVAFTSCIPAPGWPFAVHRTLQLQGAVVRHGGEYLMAFFQRQQLQPGGARFLANEERGVAPLVSLHRTHAHTHLHTWYLRMH